MTLSIIFNRKMTDWYGAIRDSSIYSRTLLFHQRGKISTSSVLKEMLHRQKTHLNWAFHMQGILLIRHCQVEVISTLKEHPKEEEHSDSWVGIAHYRLVHMHKSILQWSRDILTPFLLTVALYHRFFSRDKTFTV